MPAGSARLCLPPELEEGQLGGKPGVGGAALVCGDSQAGSEVPPGPALLRGHPSSWGGLCWAVCREGGGPGEPGAQRAKAGQAEEGTARAKAQGQGGEGGPRDGLRLPGDTGSTGPAGPDHHAGGSGRPRTSSKTPLVPARGGGRERKVGWGRLFWGHLGRVDGSVLPGVTASEPSSGTAHEKQHGVPCGRPPAPPRPGRTGRRRERPGG